MRDNDGRTWKEIQKNITELGQLILGTGSDPTWRMDASFKVRSVPVLRQMVVKVLNILFYVTNTRD